MGLKKWLSKTGMYHNGVEVIDESNPFKKVIEHPDYPLARIYRTSFWRGIKDTFDVLVGSHPKLPHPPTTERKGRKGVLDLLIFPLIGRLCLFYLMSLSIDFCEKDRNIGLKLLQFIGAVVLIAIGVPLALTRNLLGIALTLILIPIVALVHAITYPQSKQYHEEIEKLEVTSKLTGKTSKLGEKQIVRLDLEHFSRLELERSNRLELKFQDLKGSPKVFIEINATNIKGIEALLAIGAGNVLSSGYLPLIQTKLRDLKEKRQIPSHWLMQKQMECGIKDELSPHADLKQSNETPLKADLGQFLAQIHSFANIATKEEIKKAQNDICPKPSSGDLVDESLSKSFG